MRGKWAQLAAGSSAVYASCAVPKGALQRFPSSTHIKTAYPAAPSLLLLTSVHYAH